MPGGREFAVEISEHRSDPTMNGDAIAAGLEAGEGRRGGQVSESEKAAGVRHRAAQRRVLIGDSNDGVPDHIGDGLAPDIRS